jgi:AcrR family transcriptional regulator
MNNADKRTRILESAIELAERGGFEAVRLRDVAAQAEVALGTLYKRFRSKDELLIAALDLEAEKLGRQLVRRPPEGEKPQERVTAFFQRATSNLFRKPNLARAILRALTSGDEQLTQSVASFHERMTNLIVAAMRGVGPEDLGQRAPRNTELMVAFVLQQVWFSALVGWMGGLIARSMVVDQVQMTLELLLSGVRLDEG